MISPTASEVPTGTVLFWTNTLYSPIWRATSFATRCTADRSHEPSSHSGVPTAEKITSESSTAPLRSDVKRSLPAE